MKHECLQAYSIHSCYFYDFKCNLKQQSSQAQVTAGNELKDSYSVNKNHSCSISLQSMHKNHMQTCFVIWAMVNLMYTLL